MKEELALKNKLWSDEVVTREQLSVVYALPVNKMLVMSMSLVSARGTVYSLVVSHRLRSLEPDLGASRSCPPISLDRGPKSSGVDSHWIWNLTSEDLAIAPIFLWRGPNSSGVATHWKIRAARTQASANFARLCEVKIAGTVDLAVPP